MFCSFYYRIPSFSSQISPSFGSYAPPNPLSMSYTSPSTQNFTFGFHQITYAHKKPLGTNCMEAFSSATGCHRIMLLLRQVCQSYHNRIVKLYNTIIYIIYHSYNYNCQAFLRFFVLFTLFCIILSLVRQIHTGFLYFPTPQYFLRKDAPHSLQNIFPEKGYLFV